MQNDEHNVDDDGHAVQSADEAEAAFVHETIAGIPGIPQSLRAPL